MSNCLSEYIKKVAFTEGALTVGFTKIRKMEPVIVFAYPFTEKWFLDRPLSVVNFLSLDHNISRHVHAK